MVGVIVVLCPIIQGVSKKAFSLGISIISLAIKMLKGWDKSHLSKVGSIALSGVQIS